MEFEGTLIIIIAFGRVCAAICKICNSLDTVAEHALSPILLNPRGEDRPPRSRGHAPPASLGAGSPAQGCPGHLHWAGGCEGQEGVPIPPACPRSGPCTVRPPGQAPLPPEGVQGVPGEEPGAFRPPGLGWVCK